MLWEEAGECVGTKESYPDDDWRGNLIGKFNLNDDISIIILNKDCFVKKIKN